MDVLGEWLMLRGSIEESAAEEWRERVVASMTLPPEESEWARTADTIDAQWRKALAGDPSELVETRDVLRRTLRDPTIAIRVLKKTYEVMTPADRLALAAQVFDRADLVRRIELLQFIVPAVQDMMTRRKERASSPGFLTVAQSEALARIVALGKLHFSGERMGLALSLRCQPLLIGPTGTGKTALARRAAAHFSAELVRVSPGEWVPRGARDGVPTLFRILQTCVNAEMVVVAIDEIDKCSGETSNSWSRGVLAEVYSVLDRDLPAADFLRANPTCGLSVAQLLARAAGIWIVGIGTWQSLWQKRKSVGFAARGVSEQRSILDAIRKSEMIPEELLLRFAWPPIEVPYPTAAETAAIFAESGISNLAERAGVTLHPERHDWSEGGIRSIETLATDLVLKVQTQVKGDGI